MSDTAERRQRVSARLDPHVVEIVESVAQAERRPVSALIRNVVTDWAQARELEGRAA
jgi:hypothetical protein